MSPQLVSKKMLQEFTIYYPNLNIDYSSVTKILSYANEYDQLKNNEQAERTYHHYLVKHLKLELAMNIWVEQVTTNGIIISDSIIKEKGQHFANEFGISEESLVFSNGWVTKFKKRNGLRKIVLHGEVASAPLENLPTASFQDKSRVTVLLCSNSTGSDKFRPLVISSSKKPQFFNRVNRSQLPVDYRDNKKAWMRNSEEPKDSKEPEELEEPEFQERSARERSQGRSRGSLKEGHQEGPKEGPKEGSRGRSRRESVPDYSYLTNITYKKLYCNYLLSQFEKNEEQRKLTIRQAIDFILDAWSEVSDTTIRNCWKATRIMPELEKNEQEESRTKNEQESRPENEPENVISEDDDVDMLVEDFSNENNPRVRELISNIEEYTNLIDQPAVTEDALTDKDPPPSPPTITKATEALEKVIRYQESLEVIKGFKENELMMLQRKLKEWCYEKTKNKKQLSILSFY
ncbi:6708_t:CDS:2, partial [Gigaspora rosea]